MAGEPRILVDGAMEAPETLPFASGEVALFSGRGPGKSVNEDAVALVPSAEGGVLAVADGLGGQPAGDRASRLALQELARSVTDAAGGGRPLRAGILDGFERANERIQDLKLGAGTTLAVLEIRDRTARTYHVGDSAVLVTGQRGRLKLQTVSHSPVGYGVEAGLLDEREAMRHEDRHLLSNLVGSADMRIEVGPALELRPRDTVVLASDGLLDNLPIAEIVELARKGRLASQAARLAALCRDRMEGRDAGHPGKPDDVSFLLFRLRKGV